MNLLISLRSEVLKTKRSATFYLTIIAAAIIPFIILLDITSDGLQSDNKKDPLNGIYKMGFKMLYIAILPVFVVALCTLLPQIEYRNNAWKQVLASPQTKANVFFAKFLQVQLFILLMLLCFNIFLPGVIVIVHLMHPEFKIFDQPFNGSKVLTYNVNLYIAVLAISAIQFWLGLRFKNFIVPIAVGIALWITGMMMTFEFKSNLMDFFPYSFQTFPLMPELQPKMTQVAWTSAGYATLFLLLGFLDFRKKVGRA